MLVMLLIGWIVLLPALVVAALYIGSSVLGRRRAPLHAYEDLFADDDAFDPAPRHEAPEQPSQRPRPARPREVGQDVAVAERPPVAAR
jgi:hypothetical protein